MRGCRSSFLAVAIACLAAVGVVAADSAAADRGPNALAAPTDNFKATLPIVVTGSGGAERIHWADFEGSAVIPRFGHATFAGTLWTFGIPGQINWCFVSARSAGDPCYQALDLELTGENGKQLTIRGYDQWWPPATPSLPWTWASRGGDWTGSGVYATTLTADLVPYNGDTFAITLSGALHHP